MPSPTALQAMRAASSGEVFIVLVELNHSTLPQPIRVTSNGQDTWHNSNRYQQFPFEVDWPEQSDGPPPSVSLKICNVDRTIVEAARTARTAGDRISVRVSLVLASSPSVVESGPYRFDISDITYDAIYVTGTLVLEDLLNAPFPGHEYTPASHPGLFA